MRRFKCWDPTLLAQLQQGKVESRSNWGGGVAYGATRWSRSTRQSRVTRTPQGYSLGNVWCVAACDALAGVTTLLRGVCGQGLVDDCSIEIGIGTSGLKSAKVVAGNWLGPHGPRAVIPSTYSLAAEYKIEAPVTNTAFATPSW
jgi:hypothetical protein